MEEVSRRRFLKGAGTTMAVAGAATVVPLGIGAASASTRETPELRSDEGLADGEHLIAHITNARTGEIALYVGEREVIVRNRDVAAQLVRSALRGK